MKRLIAALALTSLLFTTGCYGSFQLSKDLHAWNGQVSSNKFINWLLFLGLVIVPVYEIAVIVDAVVFNSVEFWTGSNPVGGGVAAVQNDDGTVTVHRDGRELTLVSDGDRIVVREGDTELGYAVRDASGALTIYDVNGRELQHVP